MTKGCTGFAMYDHLEVIGLVEHYEPSITPSPGPKTQQEGAAIVCDSYRTNSLYSPIARIVGAWDPKLRVLVLLIVNFSDSVAEFMFPISQLD